MDEQEAGAEQTNGLAWALAVSFVGYAAAAVLGLGFIPRPGAPSMIWPAAGVAMAAIYTWGARVLPALALAAWVVDVVKAWHDAEKPLLAAMVEALGWLPGTMFGPLLAVFLLRTLDFRPVVSRLRDVLALVLAATGAATLSIVLGQVVAVVLRQPPPELQDVSTWWMGDVIGYLGVGPALLIGDLRTISWRRLALPLAVVWVAAAAVAFDPLGVHRWTPTAYLPVAPLVVVGLLGGARPVSIGFFGLAVVFAVAVKLGVGPLVPPHRENANLALGSYLLICALLSYLAGVLTESWRELLRHTRESQRRALRLISGFPGGALIVDGDRVQMNPAAHELTGWVGQVPASVRAWAEVHFGEDAEVVAALCDGPPSGGTTRFVTPLRRLSGERRVVELVGSPIGVDHVWLLHDITERAEAEERFRALFEESSTPLLLLEDGRLIGANRAVERVLGVDPSEVGGDLIAAARFAPTLQPDGTDTIERLCSLYVSAMQGGEARAEVWLGHVDGRTVPVELSFTRMVVRRRQLVLASLHDLTAQKQHETALREAKEAAEVALKARDEFVTTMSHEIRTPLHGVIGMAEVLAATSLDDRQQGQLGALRRSAGLLLSLLDDILELARLDASRPVVRPERLAVRGLVAVVMEVLRPRADVRRISLVATVADAVPVEVVVDIGVVRQSLLNLVGNAVKFTDEGGVRVEVDWSEAGGLSLIVVDSGVGIAPEAAQRLFEPFVQVDAGDGRRRGGTGLGLAITRRLVEAHGGEVKLWSLPGMGSRFEVRLPAPRALHALVDVGGAPVPLGPLVGSVLVAEDNEVGRQVIEAMLRQLGLSVEVVGDGAEAVAAARRLTPDLVLLDCHMPVLDGFGAARVLRAEGFRGPLVALTAAMEPEKADEACFDAWLRKPVSLATLRATLAGLLHAP